MTVPSLEEFFGLGTDWPEGLPEYVSASALGTFRRCPEQYRRRYLLGHKEPPNIRLLWGTADHSALEHNWRQKIDSHEDLPVTEVQEAFAAHLDEVVEQSGGESEVVWDGKKPGEIKDAGVQLVSAYHSAVSPTVQPTAVERKFSLELPGVPVPIIGYIDLETSGPVIERKTAARKATTIPGRNVLQASVYQLVTGRSVDFHFSVKTKTPQVLTPADHPGLTMPVTARELRERMVVTTVQALAATFERHGRDEPWPDAIADDHCSWCGYRPTCPWWGGTP